MQLKLLDWYKYLPNNFTNPPQNVNLKPMTRGQAKCMGRSKQAPHILDTSETSDQPAKTVNSMHLSAFIDDMIPEWN